MKISNQIFLIIYLPYFRNLIWRFSRIHREGISNQFHPVNFNQERPIKKVKVLFIWQPRDELKKYLLNGISKLTNVELIFPDNIEESHLCSLAHDVDIIIGWKPTKRLIDSATKLSILINPGAGAQHLIELFREINQTRSVILVNGHGNAYFTAQHTIGILLALLNKIITHHNWMNDGIWRQGDEHAKSIPLRNRDIGLLGYGAVNRHVHKFLSPLDNNFHILKREWNNHDGESDFLKYSPTDLNEFLKAIDILIIAIPLTSMTKELIGKDKLELLGRESFLVNVGRGPIVNEQSLYGALKNKQIAGAAIDVWYDYRPEPDENNKKYPSKYPFHELDNVVLSPHRAASPFDDLKRWDEVLDNITRFAVGSRNIINQVDIEREY